MASIAGAYFLLKLGKNIAKKRGVHAYSYAYAAAGGTVGTVMRGTTIALAFCALISPLYRKVFQKKDKRERREMVELSENLQDSSDYHCPGSYQCNGLQSVRSDRQFHVWRDHVSAGI
ncbi:MAG: hypothetical protein ACLTST_11855 [Lachnospiraceae bacterium]